MAKKSKSDDLFDVLRARGLRRRVAKAVADAESGGRIAGGKAEKVARDVLGDLEAAAGELRRRLDGGAADRSEAAKKAARTRKRNQAQRSQAARKAAKARHAKS